MALRFSNISHQYGSQSVLNGVDLIALPGEITCLLGPSGGGKSTLLYLAAGLEPLQQGEIWLDNKLLAKPKHEPAPEKRPIGLMFQNNALFPNMTVADNILFGLGRRHNARHHALVDQLLHEVGLENYAKRYPHTLSGGQQQRVALARALAPQPKVLLMDEPYASIDVTRRRVLRESARHTLKHSNTATILVTHDPIEAMEMADKIAVLDKGQIVQFGTPQDLFEQPNNATVASMFGDAQTFSGVITDYGLQTDFGIIACDQYISGLNTSDINTCGQLMTVVTRPNGLTLTATEPNTTSPHLTIDDIRYVGHQWLVFLQSQDDTLTSQLRVSVDSTEHLAIGQPVKVSACDNDFFLFER